MPTSNLFSFTATGPDKAVYPMLKHLRRSGMDFLLHVFNLSWSPDSFPSIWKTLSIIPIHKMGKPLNSPASFRPFSLTSCVSKLLKRIVLLNSLWLASLLAWFVGHNLSFLIGALVRFIKITKVVLFESVKVFRKAPFVALYLFLSSSLISLLLCLLPSVALFMLTIWSSSPSVPIAVETTQGALIRLERWSEYWCLPVNMNKCEASFFSVDSHQANPQPNFFYSTPASISIPLQLFLGSLSTTLSPKHVSSLKAKFLFGPKVIPCISASFWAPLSPV